VSIALLKTKDRNTSGKNMKRRRNENLAKVIVGSIVTLKTDYRDSPFPIRVEYKQPMLFDVIACATFLQGYKGRKRSMGGESEIPEIVTHKKQTSAALCG
jgi:hypothetical protein